MAKKHHVKGHAAIDRKLQATKKKIAALKKNAALKKRLQQKISALKKAEAQLAGLKRRKK